MVATFMPRMVRAMSGKEARATPVHLNTRGMEGGHGHLGAAKSGDALHQAFGGAGQVRESGDPAVSGDFARMPVHTLYGFPIGGGGLSPRGMDQKAASGRLQAFSQSYLSAIQNGATTQEAFRAAVRANPSGLQDLMMHPTALQSMEQLGQVLTGGQDAGPKFSQVKGADGKLYNVPIDPQTGQAGAAESIPGLPGTPAKPGKPTLLKTDQGFATLGPDGTATPVLGPNGERVRPAPTGAAAKQPPLAQSDIQGLPPQVTSDIPKTAFNRQNYNTLATTPAVMQALGRIQKAADAMGPLKGPVASLSGQYLGLNGQGAQFRADLDLIQSQAQRMASSGYKAATENFIKGIGTASDAPSFLRLQSAQMMATLRSEAQSTADEETASHQGKLPPSLAHQLISVGVVPNGYQNQQTLDQMPPGEAALWKSRNFPQALTPADKNQLFTDAAHGKFGAPGQANQNPDFKAILGIHQQYKAQQQAQAQQGVASQAATAVQPASANPGQGTPGLGRQPTEGANPGAGQPANGQVQNGQPGQQGAAQPPANPQQLGQQGQDQNGQGQGVAPQPAGAGLLMPPQAVPGQPAQGVPATGGSTPMPAVNPLPAAPQTSQMLTPQGGMPTPAVQAPLAATAPGSQVPTSAGGALVQAHQDALAAQAQAEQENGGQPVAAPSAEGLSLMPGM